jgi:hypothetical protein
MYTHARQFPHLAGLDDVRVREIAARGMSRRPDLVRIHRLRSVALMTGMIAAMALLSYFSSLKLGLILMLVGGIATAFLLCWNLVWVNTVLYRVTRDEIQR